MATEWVCDPTKVSVCKCADADFCGCTEEPNIIGDCDRCGAPMLLVNVATGEPAAEAKAAS